MIETELMALTGAILRKANGRSRISSFLPVDLLLGIYDGGVPPGSPNSDPISDQMSHFQTWSLKSISVY